MGRMFGERSLCKMARETWMKTSSKVMAQVDIESVATLVLEVRFIS